MFESNESSEPFPTHEEAPGEPENPEAGEPAAGGKPDDTEDSGESGRERDAPPGEQKAEATPEIGGEGGKREQSQVSGDPGEAPGEE